MRALLNPIIIRELDQVILRPGRSLMSLFYGPVVIAPAGEMETGRKPGLLPQEQPLLLDPAFSSFWMEPEVLRAPGGSVQSWARKFNVCQWNHGADEYHHQELTTAKYEQSGLCLCWHHDRVLVDQPPALVADIARQNAAQYILESVRSHITSLLSVTWVAGHWLNELLVSSLIQLFVSCCACLQMSQLNLSTARANW